MKATPGRVRTSQSFRKITNRSRTFRTHASECYAFRVAFVRHRRGGLAPSDRMQAGNAEVQASVSPFVVRIHISSGSTADV
jgi:hypothetical protein